ncbi:MAG: glycosyltransferase [Solirubrobacteraceae bacterium]
MSTPRVSVVIPCFNYGRYLAEAVQSVLAQSISELELIIVDDGSTDDSAAVAQALIERSPPAAIQLLRQPNSGSPGHTRNAGITHAKAPYVVCLDADDKLDPSYLAACAGALDAHPEAAIAYGDMQMFGDALNLIRPPEWDTRRELDSNILGTAAMFRRQAWEQVGGYDTEIGYEDWDFWIGCVEAGWVGVKAPGALWHYRVHSGGVFRGHLRSDQEIKAHIVLRHPSLYDERQRAWAGGVLRGDPHALSAGRENGVMPLFAPAIDTHAAPPIRSICLITKDYPPSVPGGIPRAVQMQGHRLAAAGVEVHVITKSVTGAEGTRQDNGVIVHEVPEPGLAVPGALSYLEIPLWSFVAATKFAALDETVRFDIVETPDYRGEALHVTPRPDTALIVWLHSTMKVVWDCEPEYECSPTDDAWHALEMAALQRADLLLAPSQLLSDTTTSYLGERMRPVELMPYLFDSSQFPATERRRLGAHDTVNVLFYGRLEARKNPELALRAVAAARANGLNSRLTVVGRNGGGYQERVLDPLQRELGLPDVEYVPHVELSQLRAVLDASHVAILPSRFDNSPLTIFEALSSGLPVITSDRVGTAGWFGAEDGLLALPVDDPEAFAQRAAAAIGDPEFMATGPRAAERMRDRFSPQVVTERLLSCYAKLLHGRRREPISGARGTAVIAFADELLADPDLLQEWSEHVSASDDVTLVIYAPDWTAEDAAQRLAPAVARAGLDGEDAADLLAIAVPKSDTAEARLAAGADGLLSRRPAPAPFDRLPVLDNALSLLAA